MSHLAEESRAADPSSLEFGEGFRVVHRTIVRPDMELDVTSLYVGGVSGSAYVVAGVGMTVLTDEHVVVVPIRTGIGARLGITVGYLKLTQQPTWNPF